ncbi:hypothetical protein PV325_008006 [Microctonus aethiopoides]|nr:hypothetical protein PV325_008006 [Microctonus aethiopoides]
MAVQIIPIHCCILLLGVLSFLIIKTHAFHDILETTIVDENKKEIKLKWVKTKRSFLANQNLPIWNMYSLGQLGTINYFLDEKDKNDFIDYTAYHDFDKFSAVIYVKKLECLIGVIDTRYSIKCLPISQLHQKHHIVKNEVDGYIILINPDHCDRSCYNLPNTIPNLFNSPPYESGPFLPTDSDSFRLKYRETIRQSAPNLDSSKLTNINSKEFPSTSFNPDCSSTHESDSSINPSFPNSESSIIHNDEAPSPLSSNVDISELVYSYIPSVSPQFGCPRSSLLSDSTSSANPPPGFNDFKIALSDKHKSSNDPRSSNFNTDLLSDSDFLNFDPDDNFFHSQQNLDFIKLSDTDLKRLLPSVSHSAPPSARDSNPSVNLLSPDSNFDLPHFSESSIINQDETPSLINPQFPINVDFSALTDTVLERHLPSTSDIYSPPIKRSRIERSSDKKQLDTLYPEILIFVSNDMVNYEKKERGLIESSSWLIYRFIAYFNAVDMLFAQLEKYGIDIHVNIAGIIIEKDPDSLKNRFEIRNHLHVMDKLYLDYIQQFIRISIHAINMNSFDFFHLATIEESNEGNQNYGFSTDRFSIFDQRAKRVNRNNMKVAGSIVQHPKHVQNYVVAARELAHLMEIDYETTENLFDDSGVLKKIARLPLPVDGTKCGENKVCFRRKCIETSVENRYKDS